MLNPFKDVNWNPNLAERRKFAKSLVIGFPVVALIFLLAGWALRGHWDANLKIAFSVGAGGLAAGGVFWVLPQIAWPFYAAWTFLGCCMGIVIGNLLFAAFFYLILTPFGLIRRMFRPAVQKGFDPGAATYWRDAKKTEDPASYFKQF